MGLSDWRQRLRRKILLATDKTRKWLSTSAKKNQPRFTDGRQRSKTLTDNRQSNEILIDNRHADLLYSYLPASCICKVFQNLLSRLFHPKKILHFRVNSLSNSVSVIITTETLRVLCQPNVLTQRKVTRHFWGLPSVPYLRSSWYWWVYLELHRKHSVKHK